VARQDTKTERAVAKTERAIAQLEKEMDIRFAKVDGERKLLRWYGGNARLELCGRGGLTGGQGIFLIARDGARRWCRGSWQCRAGSKAVANGVVERILLLRKEILRCSHLS